MGKLYLAGKGGVEREEGKVNVILRAGGGPYDRRGARPGGSGPGGGDRGEELSGEGRRGSGKMDPGYLYG